MTIREYNYKYNIIIVKQFNKLKQFKLNQKTIIYRKWT